MVNRSWNLIMVASGVLALAYTVSIPVAASAQDRAEGETPVCMVKARPDNVNVVPGERGSPLYVVVAGDDLRSFKKYGFEETPCERSGHGERAQKERYRDEMCELAAFGNQAVQLQLSKSLGVSPSALCASAQKAVGRWRGPPSSEVKEEVRGE